MRRATAAAALVAAAVAALAGCAGDDEGSSTAAGDAGTTVAARQTSPGVSFGRLETGVVAHVDDGDSITLRGGTRIRLVQIDAPELTDECWGRGARREAERLLPPGTRVTLKRDAVLDDRDRFGRRLRYVEAKGLNVNAELVVVGAAVPYFFRGERGRYAKDLLLAVAEARRTKAGMWKACPRARLDPRLGSLTGPA